MRRNQRRLPERFSFSTGQVLSLMVATLPAENALIRARGLGISADKRRSKVQYSNRVPEGHVSESC